LTRKGALLFAAMCVIWGIPYLMIRVAVRELTPATLVFLRTGIAAFLLVPIAALQGSLRPLLARWRPFVAFTLIEVAIPWFLLAKAETKLSSSLTALLIAATPLVGAAIVTSLGDREWHRGRRRLGLIVGFAGVAAIVGLNVQGASAFAIAEVFGVAVCYAVGPIMLSRYLGGLPALGVTAASLGLTALLYLPFVAAQRPHSMPSAHVIESVLGLALICTVLAFLLFFALIGEVGPVKASVITYVNPAVAAVAGVAVLGEKLTAGMLVGFALVLAGAILATGGASEAVPELQAQATTAN
jgi:drug/metabolite transporter (DMT)-like permease